MKSLNHKRGKNLNGEYKSQNMVKTQIMNLNHKHGNNSK